MIDKGWKIRIFTRDECSEKVKFFRAHVSPYCVYGLTAAIRSKISTGFWSQSFRQKNAQEALPNLPLCASFWRRVWLQKPVETFLCVVRIRSEYVKHFPRSGKCIAVWFMNVRSTKHSLLKERWLSSGFFEIQICEALPSFFDFRSA